MRQADIDRAVARATGETVALIRQLGFTLLSQPTPIAPRPRNQHRGRRCRAARRCRQPAMALA